MKNFRPDLLSRPIFIWALGFLLLNDFYLKYEYSNFLTGKLSDVAGLFIFPYFLSSLISHRLKTVYFSTVILFIFWKTEFSQSIIDWFQTNGINFNRVVDYTDFVALLILPLSYNYFLKEFRFKSKKPKAFTLPISILSLIAIWATTLPRAHVVVNMDVDRTFELEMSKTELLNKIATEHPYSDTLQKNITDTLFYLTYGMNSFNAQVTTLASIKLIDTGKTVIRLDSILHGAITGGLFTGVDKNDLETFRSLTSAEFESYFEKNFIEPIRKNE